ncbi:unnamed protein product, partial [Brenthis ino]
MLTNSQYRPRVENVGGVSTPCLEEHVKPSVLSSEFEMKGKESAPVSPRTVVVHLWSTLVEWLVLLRLTAVDEIGQVNIIIIIA